jgi:hypothetical protein
MRMIGTLMTQMLQMNTDFELAHGSAVGMHENVDDRNADDADATDEHRF